MQLELNLANQQELLNEQDVKHWIELDGATVSYILVRRKRKTLSFVYNEQGLQVRAPLRISIKSIEESLQKKSAWILQQRAYFLDMQKHRPLPMIAWQHDTEFLFLGNTLRLRLDAGNAFPRLLTQNGLQYLSVQLTPDLPRDMVVHVVTDWLKAQAKEHFYHRLLMFSQEMGLAMPSWRLSSAKTSWGSCNAKGNISLNWRLIHFPLHIIDYVIVHELAHIKELNHSDKFWQIVRQTLPDFLTAQQFLRKSALSYLPMV